MLTSQRLTAMVQQLCITSHKATLVKQSPCSCLSTKLKISPIKMGELLSCGPQEKVCTNVQQVVEDEATSGINFRYKYGFSLSIIIYC